MATAVDRQRILAEAGELFLAGGPGGVTMRGLAQRIGVTPMALYRYFPSRDELLQALVADGHATFLAYLSRSLAADTPLARLAACGREYIAFAFDHPRSYAVMFMEHIPCDDTAHPAWPGAATFRFLVDRVRDCAAAGDLGPADPEAVALSLWAVVHGLASLHLAGKLGMPRPEFERVCLESMTRMLAGWAPGGPEIAPPEDVRRKPKPARGS